VIELIQRAGRLGVPIPGDLRDSAFCQRLVDEARQKLGGLDIIVCNAGRQQAKPSILDISDEDFDATMKTNIYAPFYIIKAALPHLTEGSCIIGTISEQAYDPDPDLYDYAQTKAATMNYVKSLAKQLGPRGIRVNAVAPGPIWTPLQISGGAPIAKYTLFGSTTALGRDSLATLLQMGGHDVRVVYHGRAALLLAQSFRPDVALLDIGMPEVSGYEIAAQLRGEPWGQAIQLFAVTGWGQDGDVDHPRRLVRLSTARWPFRYRSRSYFLRRLAW